LSEYTTSDSSILPAMQHLGAAFEAENKHRTVAFTPVNPAKLQADADLDSHDDEVRHIPHCPELPRPPGMELFSESVAKLLVDAYSPSVSLQTGLIQAQMHTCMSHAANSCSGLSACNSRVSVSTRSHEPELELETKPFLVRSAIFLRVKQPQRWGRGYRARSQPFKQQDIQAWKSILAYDWTCIMGDNIDFVVFINHWFEMDFTLDLLERMCRLDPLDTAFDDIVAGSALRVHLDMQETQPLPIRKSNNSPARCRPTEQLNAKFMEWQCEVCKEVWKDPPLDQPDGQHSSRRFRQERFCSKCWTSRHDKNVWLCQGPGSARCYEVMQMRDAPLGVPCMLCSTVRPGYHWENIFELWSNIEDEPLPQNNLRA